jgi:hypothetical protein
VTCCSLALDASSSTVRRSAFPSPRHSGSHAASHMKCAGGLPSWPAQVRDAAEPGLDTNHVQNAILRQSNILSQSEHPRYRPQDLRFILCPSC